MSAISDVLEGRSQWALVEGDCLDPVNGLGCLPDGIVDHCITDPPYEAEAHTRQRRCRDVIEGRARSAALDFEEMNESTRNACAKEIVRACRRWILVFCQVEAAMIWRLAAHDARYVRTMVWVKPDGSPQFTGDRPGMGYESILTLHCTSNRLRWNAGGRRGVYECLTGKNVTGHPTQKPLALITALVRDFTDVSDLIIDPFAGSGTTGVAALQAGRRFIGWELDARYAAIARNRLSSAREQLEIPLAMGGSL